MIVYAETNFLLELAYLQEHRDSCAELIHFAKAGRIVLVLPSFSCAEARSTWHRRASERRDFQATLQRTIRQLARSEPFRDLNGRSKELIAALVASGEEARERLEIAIDEIHTYGIVHPLTNDIIVSARQHERSYSLSPPDALVLASIVSHASGAVGEQKCFVSQDAKGFANPSIYDELSAYNCRVIVNFADAVAYVKTVLGAP